MCHRCFELNMSWYRYTPIMARKTLASSGGVHAPTSSDHQHQKHKNADIYHSNVIQIDLPHCDETKTFEGIENIVSKDNVGGSSHLLTFHRKTTDAWIQLAWIQITVRCFMLSRCIKPQDKHSQYMLKRLGQAYVCTRSSSQPGTAK